MDVGSKVVIIITVCPDTHVDSVGSRHQPFHVAIAFRAWGVFVKTGEHLAFPSALALVIIKRHYGSVSLAPPVTSC